VALTFDDGPGVTTSQILAILQQYGVPATFFNIGGNQAARPTLVRSEATLGIVLGNHTWDHPQMQLLSASAQASELDQTINEQVALVGRAPCFFRPPYGSYNSTTLTLAQQRHMAVWNWSVDTLDWQAGTSTSSYWVNRIISLAESEGAALQHPVILMHNQPTGTYATVLALPTIINFFASRGYQFVTLAGTPGLGFPGPAATATAGGVHVFARATSGALTERTQGSGGTWTGAVAEGGVLVGSPAATQVTATSSEAFVIGTDNGIWEQTIADTGASSGWTTIGGLATSRPAATTGANGVTTVAVRGTDSAAWIRQQSAGTWGAWQPLGGVFNSALAVTATPGGGLAVAGVGADNALWVRVETGTTWSAWQRVASVVNDDPALTVTPSGSLLAVVRGTDGAGWVSVGDPTGTTWTWQRIGGALASAPTVALVGSAAAVFVVGTNGQTFENVASDASTGSGWGGWQALP
jgi:peptidoglycan/xylan/chitin deacetylase (PgdA/CDA1 family)